MPLTTVANVRLTGGINDADAYLMWRLADDDALNDEVERKLALASAWLSQRAENAVYTGSATADTALDTLFGAAEEALVMHYLTMPLKSRKVMGTHFPYDSEGSERFAELIDVEWLAQMEGLAGAYLDSQDTPGKDFALPAFGATSTILNSDLDAVTVTLDNLLQRAENRAPSQSGSFVFP